MKMSLSGDFSGSLATSTGGGSREFEIARVLASLGNNNHATKEVVDMEEEEGSVGGSGGEAVERQGGSKCWPWGSKGKRSSSNVSCKRVKGSSSSPHSSTPTVFPFDLNLDQAAIFQDECQSGDVKMEEVCESEPGLVSHPPQNSSRSRHNLTEEEKEARRIRRILANRESARQTIRRRQAFHEELTRKAAELASENESLKRSKEMIVKEFQALQTTNQKLKGQLSQTLGFKLGGNKVEAESSHNDHTHNLHSANWSCFMGKKSSASPFMFPACVPSSDVNLSQSSRQFYGLCKFPDQENAITNMNGEKMPWCILPCPVLLPMANIKDGIHQLSPTLLKDRNDGGSFCKHVYSPSSVICAQNCPLLISADKNTVCLPSRQCHELNDFHQQVPRSPCCSRGELTHEREDSIRVDPLLNPEFSSATSRSVDNPSVPPETRKDVTNKKDGSTVAGAEARRKRKELMKLKSRLHYHLLGKANG